MQLFSVERGGCVGYFAAETRRSAVRQAKEDPIMQAFGKGKKYKVMAVDEGNTADVELESFRLRRIQK